MREGFSGPRASKITMNSREIAKLFPLGDKPR
jgi:hypothetical protein